jgi:CheY-like chemotaxis protein
MPARTDTLVILAVDDCPVQRELLMLQLESAGYSALVVETGEEALQAARSVAFDAVILDVNMPGMDGLQIGRALRADPATHGALIIMHTSESEALVRERFAGFDGFLNKSAVTPMAERIRRMVRERVRAPGAVAPAAPPSR